MGHCDIVVVRFAGELRGEGVVGLDALLVEVLGLDNQRLLRLNDLLDKRSEIKQDQLTTITGSAASSFTVTSVSLVAGSC